MERMQKLLENLAHIQAALSDMLGPLYIPMPESGTTGALNRLKRHEDALDALVCAWVGIRFIAGEAVPLGDEHAAIWCPRDVVMSENSKPRFLQQV